MRTSVLSPRAFRKEGKFFLERLSTIISSISTFFTSNLQECCLVNLINFYTMTEDRIADGSPATWADPKLMQHRWQDSCKDFKLQLHSSLKPRYPRRKPSRTLNKISFYYLNHKTNVQMKRSQTTTSLTQRLPWMPCSTRTKAPTWRSRPMAKINAPRQSRILLIA